jgi:hypothetical protein
MLSTVAIFVAGFMAGLCSRATAQEEADYFPLEVGNWWEYVASADSESCRVTVTDTEQHNGRTYWRLVSTPYSWWPDKMLYRKEDSKVYWKGYKHDGSTSEEFLCLDFSAREPDTWWVDTPDGPVQVPESVAWGSDPPGVPFLQLVAVDETATVPAGTFSRCVTFLSWGGDPILEPGSQRTLAPHVGIVRMIPSVWPWGPVLELVGARIGGKVIGTGIRGSTWGRVRTLELAPEGRW